VSSTDTSETMATPAFIDNVNANVSLVMHVGDIHSGSQYMRLSPRMKG
jgi:hypothetical protein